MIRKNTPSSKIKSHKYGLVSHGTGRDTYKYYISDGKKAVYFGVTNDLDHREKEHQKTSPGSRIVKVGRKTTKAAALKWEKSAGFPNGSQVQNATKKAIQTHRYALKELGRL